MDGEDKYTDEDGIVHIAHDVSEFKTELADVEPIEIGAEAQ